MSVSCSSVLAVGPLHGVFLQGVSKAQNACSTSVVPPEGDIGQKTPNLTSDSKKDILQSCFVKECVFLFLSFLSF